MNLVEDGLNRCDVEKNKTMQKNLHGFICKKGVSLDTGQLNVLRLYRALKIVARHTSDGNMTGLRCIHNFIFRG